MARHAVAMATVLLHTLLGMVCAMPGPGAPSHRPCDSVAARACNAQAAFCPSVRPKPYATIKQLWVQHLPVVLKGCLPLPVAGQVAGLVTITGLGKWIDYHVYSERTEASSSSRPVYRDCTCACKMIFQVSPRAEFGRFQTKFQFGS